MNDNRTEETLDTLADLFLTGTAPASPEPPKPVAPVRMPPKVAMSTPPKLKLHPAPDASGSDGVAFVQSNDALLRDVGQKSQAVLLGQVPGLAGPWVTQYAQQLSEQFGPVALLQLDEEHVSLDLVQPQHCQEQTSANAIAQNTPTQAISYLAHRPHWPTRKLLVRLELDQEPGNVERLQAFDTWTLLVGAEDQAIVASYRELKQLIQANQAMENKQIQLLVLGADATTAQAAAEKFTQATDQFLKTPVHYMGAIQRLAPAKVSTLAGFHLAQMNWQEMIQAMQTPVAPVVEATTPPMPQQTVSAPVVETPQVAHTPAPEVVENEAMPSLAATLLDASEPGHIAGGLIMEARCPNQPDVEMILDEQGVLHLIAHAVDELPMLQQAVLDLMEAQQWAGQHLDLLQLTQRQCTFDTQTKPVLHLLTNRADWGIALNQRLGERLNLHLLRQVKAGGHQVWFRTALN